MMYALIVNDAVSRYPYSLTALRLDNPNTSLPAVPSDETLAEFGMQAVHASDPPAYDLRQQALEEDVPVFNAATGRWEQSWIVRGKTDEELADDVVELKKSIVQATQARLDAFARERGYDDIKSASDYAGCSVPRFAAEGTYCRDARAETWDALYTMLAEVQAGTRPMPSGFADIESELPALVWPASV